MWNQLMRKFVAWLDPKLEQYRKKVKTPQYTPKDLKDFIELIRRTPKEIISDRDRAKISAVMSFDGRKVKDLMIPKSDLVFVYEKDFLGPLTLDKLYKSGFTHFPVIDSSNHARGIIHTEALNALEIKKADRAEKYLSQDVYYLHDNDPLTFAVDEILRLDATYFLVLNKHEELSGFITLDIILRYLLGENMI